MSNRVKKPSPSTNVLFVPLNKLKKSAKNVRKVPHSKADIMALAASIIASACSNIRLSSRRSGQAQADRQLSGQCRRGPPPCTAAACQEERDQSGRADPLDMAVYWHSTVDGYFGRAPKNAYLRPCVKASPRTPPSASPP
jgi:hypothetical protein